MSSITDFFGPFIALFGEWNEPQQVLMKLQQYEYYRQLRRLRDLKEDQALAAESAESLSAFLNRLKDHTQKCTMLLSTHANPTLHARWLGS